MEDVTNEDERIEETPGSPESAGELLAPSPEALEQVEKLMQQANLAKIRGQNSIADKLLAEAIELAPQAPQVLLAIADDFAERRQFTKAKEAYKKALEADPSNKAIETKYAEMVLQTDLPTDPFAYMAQADVGTMASGAAAVVLNVFFPGLGQIVLGKVGKGIAFLVVAAICWAGVLLMPGGLPGVISFMTSGKSVPGFSSLSMLFLGVGVLNWLFAIIDTSASAKRMKPMKVERPVIPDISEFIKKDSDPR